MSQEGRGCLVGDQGGSDKVAQFKMGGLRSGSAVPPYIGKKKQVTKDKSIEADSKTRTQLFFSRVVSKPFFGVYDQDVIEAAYALTATNKTL